MSLAPVLAAVAAGIGGVSMAVLSAPQQAAPPAPSRTARSAAAVRPDAPPAPLAAVRPDVPAAPLAAVRPRVAGGTTAVPRVARVASFRWPLSPAPGVLRRFVVGPEPWSPGHRGVDLAAAAGQPVLAAGDGTVTFAGVLAGRGVVAVTHPDGIRTTYEPVTASVRTGQAVTAGTRLGLLEQGAHCRGVCLHWGALRGDVYLDPLTLLRPPEPPILLPLGTSA